MATEVTQAPVELGHGGEPIVRDRLYIGGQWVEPSGSGTIEVVDAATEEVMGSIPEGTPEDVDRAVQAARGAFEAWSQTSVANPWGELHDTPGVWIGDGSAFPTATGTNPMISIMALAHRTAEAIAGTSDEPAREPAAATAS